MVILSSKNGFQKQMGTKKSVIGLSKSILLIAIGFLIKFRVWRWIRNFKILFHSRVMSYESFFEKLLYDSYMTHNIYNIHIIWLQILFLIQWCKNFWDSPTQNFQMNEMTSRRSDRQIWRRRILPRVSYRANHTLCDSQCMSDSVIFCELFWFPLG